MAAPSPARSTWNLPDLLPAAVLDPLIGPGAPFELVDDKVLGQELRVFVNRPRTLREMFDRSVAAADDLEFLVSPTGTWTFGRAREAIDRDRRRAGRSARDRSGRPGRLHLGQLGRVRPRHVGGPVGRGDHHEPERLVDRG